MTQHSWAEAPATSHYLASPRLKGNASFCPDKSKPHCPWSQPTNRGMWWEMSKRRFLVRKKMGKCVLRVWVSSLGVVFDSSQQPHRPRPVHKRVLLGPPPEHILNPSLCPHPGLGTATSCLDSCPSLPGLLTSILSPWQFVIYLEPEGAFKDVNQMIIFSNL